MKIAIQGIKGSYHHEVAKAVFGNGADIVACASFSEIPPLVARKEVDKAIMAIENTIAGAILPNYALIDEYNLQICGEYYLPIQHQLLSISEHIDTITEVRSHPMALEQCRKFFRAYPGIKLIEDIDTAAVAKEIQEKNLQGVAAIASKTAADIYNLKIVAGNIQTNKSNYTRFIIISKKNGNTPSEYNKASIKFTLHHHTGSLLEILQVFKNNKLNMSKIQSLPIVEKPWEYSFFVDLIFEKKEDLRLGLERIKNLVLEMKVLGRYNSTKNK